jgi:hypothetical protein
VVYRHVESKMGNHTLKIAPTGALNEIVLRVRFIGSTLFAHDLSLVPDQTLPRSPSGLELSNTKVYEP